MMILNEVIEQINELNITDVYRKNDRIIRIEWTTSNGNTMMVVEDDLKIFDRPIVLLYRTTDTECFAKAAFCEEQLDDLVTLMKCFK